MVHLCKTTSEIMMMPYSAGHQFQSISGPADKQLHRSEIEGYQPVSRIGEIVLNAFVDAYEFTQLPDTMDSNDYVPGAPNTNNRGTATAEFKPHFHEWASALPGMIAVSRKSRSANFRNYVAAETAMPVVVCAACQKAVDEDNFFFAGIVRSKSVRSIDDGNGPQTDEFFTLSIGGMATILNNSMSAIFPGDVLEWTFYSELAARSSEPGYKRQKTQAPRRFGIKVADPLSERVIGRALSFAKPGEVLDILLRGC